jgi:hypothetical protein
MASRDRELTLLDHVDNVKLLLWAGLFKTARRRVQAIRSMEDRFGPYSPETIAAIDALAERAGVAPVLK